MLTGSLRQETSLVLVLIALERYLAQVDHDLYLTVFSPGLTLLYILASLVSSVALYAAIVFLRSGFYLSTSAFSVCEPHYESVQVLILTSCVFYFPTTMLLMYCYGTIYHSQKLKMKNRSVDNCSFLTSNQCFYCLETYHRSNLQVRILHSIFQSYHFWCGLWWHSDFFWRSENVTT